MAKNNEKTVGVIGGLGPKATLDFYSKVIERTLANTDQDHLHVIINSNPKVPNRQNALSGLGPSCAPDLIEAAQSLETAGADFLVMVCNTAHAYESHIKSAVNVPFISIIDETIKHALTVKPRIGKVGILAATGCIDANLYQKKFATKGVDCIVPNYADQHTFMELIYRVKANQIDLSITLEMERIANSLIDQGADIILAACTEVPLVLHEEYLPVPFIKSTDVLVDAVINFAQPTTPPQITAPRPATRVNVRPAPAVQANQLGRFVQSQLS